MGRSADPRSGTDREGRIAPDGHAAAGDCLARAREPALEQLAGA